MSNVSIKYLEDENGQRFSPVVNIKGIYDDSGNSLLDIFYPVGSYYETSDDNFNPNTSWGGTWKQDSKGRVTVGYDTSQTYFNTIGKTGGESTHKLTINEMPNHQHQAHLVADIQAGQPTASGNWLARYNINTNSNDYVLSTGNDQAHNNLQPYITVIRWHRTA